MGRGNLDTAPRFLPPALWRKGPVHTWSREGRATQLLLCQTHLPGVFYKARNFLESTQVSKGHLGSLGHVYGSSIGQGSLDCTAGSIGLSQLLTGREAVENVLDLGRFRKFINYRPSNH